MTFIMPARKGEHLETLFTIADALLKDQDDMVQKGYGWMLKAAGEAHPKAVSAYLMGKNP